MTGSGREDLDRLLASIEEERSTPRASPPPPEDKGPRRGFLDLLAVVFATYALVVATPVGQLLERGYNAIAGRKAKTRPLISYFETDTGAPSGNASLAQLEEIVKPPKARAPVSIEAKKVGVPSDVARALVMMLSGGKRVGEHYDVQLLESGRGSFFSVGVAWPAPDAPAKEREKALLDAVSKLSARLGGLEPAVAATAVDLTAVAYAVDRARAAGSSNPTAYEAFGRFMPGDLRIDTDPLVNGTFALVTAFSMHWPVPYKTPITSSFGWRTHPVLGTKKLHTGTDLAVVTGTEIRAVADGVVQFAGQDSVNGKFVKIEHGHGLGSAYCHASELLVRRGDHVSRGDVIMLSGQSGRATGPHLHFELKLDGQRVDAELFKRREKPGMRARRGR